MDPIKLLILMVAAHALCDYPLQGAFLSKAKNRFMPLPGVPWLQALGAHAAIHAGAVVLLTGLWWLAVFEWLAHALVDDAKCAGRIGFNADQALHLLCKFGYVLVVWWVA